MIYRKSLLLVCCCKLCCVYCGPKLRLVQSFQEAKVPPIPGLDRAECRVCRPGQSSLHDPYWNQLGCAEVCGIECDTICGVECDKGCSSDCTEFGCITADKSVAWILDFLKKKCCSHKHNHNHNHNHNHYPSFVWTPGEIPEILRQTKKKHRTLNQPATQSITSQR